MNCIFSDKVERSDLQGNYREVVVETAIHPFAVTVFGHYIYWTDWKLGKCIFCCIFNCFIKNEFCSTDLYY